MYHIAYCDTYRQGRLKGGQIGQLPGAPNFGGPMNYLRHFMKKKMFLTIFLIYY